jgi:branched-chain amino acid transport system permease protein
MKRTKLILPLAAALLWIAILALPQFAVGDSVLTLSIVTFTAGALASSWNILAGYTGQVSLGHAAFFGIGALVTRLLWVDYGISIGLSFIVGGAAALIFALIIGAPALRLKGIYFAIGTLAMGEALRVTIANVLPIVTRLPAPELIAYDLTPRYYLTFGVLTLAMITSFLIGRSRFGLGLMTIREDEQAAQSLGVNVFTHKMSAFAISAMLAGLAGSAFAFYHVSYYFDLPFGPVWTFDGLLITFVGGIGTLAGPIIGSVFFVLVRDVLAKTWVDFHLILFGVLFILVVLLLPGGLVEFWTKLTSAVSRRTGTIAEPPQG